MLRIFSILDDRLSLRPLFPRAEAVRTAVPTGVDVSSGVCQPDGLAKDPVKVTNFVERAASGLGLTQSSLHA